MIQEKGDLRFEFYRETQPGSRRFEKANAYTVKVNMDLGSRVGGNPVVWHIRHSSWGTDRLSEGASTIAYGEVPDGFVQIEPRAGFAPPLLPNTPYFVSAYIGAAVGSTSFVYQGRTK